MSDPSDAILCQLLRLIAWQEVVINNQEVAINNLARELSATQTDPLTGLATERTLRDFVDPFEQDLPAGIGHVLFVDGNHVKQVNDGYGHDAGNAVIRHIADAIRGALDAGGLAVRRGGDEFLALVAPGQSVGDALARIEEGLSAPLPVGGPAEGVTLDRLETVQVTVSIGVRRVDLGVRFSALLTDADAAMYVAKANGRDKTHYHHWGTNPD